MDSQLHGNLTKMSVIFRYKIPNVGGFELAKSIMVAQSMISHGPNEDGQAASNDDLLFLGHICRDGLWTAHSSHPMMYHCVCLWRHGYARLLRRRPFGGSKLLFSKKVG